MADDQPQSAPEGLDDFLAEQDPQAAIAAKGWQTIAAQPVVQKAFDFGGNLDAYQHMLNGAIAGDPEMQQKFAEHNLGIAMGSLRTVPEAQPLEPTKFAGAVAPGAVQRIETNLVGQPTTGTNLLKEVDAATQAGTPGVTQQDLAMATQKANRELSRPTQGTRPKRYAKGGRVPDSYIPPPSVPVSQIPSGMDEFLQKDIESHQSPTQITSQGVEPPPGLDEFIAPEMKQAQYGTGLQQAKAGLEGVAQGIAGPLAPAAEKALGVKPEDILGREEANPITHLAGEVAGLVGPAALTGGTSAAARFTQAGLMEAAGSVIAKKIAGETLASKIGAAAAKGAVENMILAGGDETSKMLLNDPNTSAQTAMATIGLAGALGGGLGATAGGLGSLWKASMEGKTGKLIEDFKGRLSSHMDGIDPITAVTKELQDHHTGITSLADEVYGPKGLKAQDIAKSMPEMSNKILDQATDMADHMDSVVKTMSESPESYPPRLVHKATADLQDYLKVVTNPEATSGDIFNALQDAKQTFQDYSKFDKFVKPIDEAYDFVKDSKNLSFKIRSALEDPAVWGAAAKRQQTINKAFTEYLPALKDFERKFTSEIGGEKVIDPGKVATYMNQLDKPNGEIKKEMLKNFLDASDRYKKVIDASHANLGLDSPVSHSSLTNTLSTLGEKSAGTKLADMFIHKGLTDAAGKGLGGVIGGMAGGAIGHPGIGAVVGAANLGPFFNSVLNGITKTILNSPGSATGFKAALDYGLAVAKGETILNKAAKNVFREQAEPLAKHMLPDERDREKLNKSLRKAQTNPEAILNQHELNAKTEQEENRLQHYMPDHNQALQMATGTAVTYLNSLRADMDKKSPLDTKPQPSSTQIAKFNNALNIAQQPLILLDKIKAGTLSLEDMQHLTAMYPDLYANMKQKLTNELIETTSKGNTVPYKTRLGLSLFMGQPLDSTMNPTSILAAQSASTTAKAAEQQQAAPIKKSTSNLSKMPGLYSTQGQTRDAHRQKQ